MKTNENRIMKKIAALSMIFLSIQFSMAQEKLNLWPLVDTTNRFNDVNTPFLEGLTFWVQRQNITTKGFQIKINSEIPFDEGLDYNGSNRYFEAFIPLLHYKNFGSNVGVAQNKNVIVSDDNIFTKNLQYNYYILILQYTTGKWKFGLSGEYFFASDALINNSKTGNEWMPLFTLAYAFSNKWQLMSFFGYNTNFRETDNITTPIIAMEFKYNPSQRFHLVFGAPVIAGLDWNVFGDLNFTGKIFLNKDTEANLSYFINDNIRLSAMYNSSQYRRGKSFFSSEVLSINNQDYTVNNVLHYHNTLSIETGIKLQKNTNMTISCGYKFKSNIELSYNDQNISNLTSIDNYFVKIGVHYLLYH